MGDFKPVKLAQMQLDGYRLKAVEMSLLAEAYLILERENERLRPIVEEIASEDYDIAAISFKARAALKGGRR